MNIRWHQNKNDYLSMRVLSSKWSISKEISKSIFFTSLTLHFRSTWHCLDQHSFAVRIETGTILNTVVWDHRFHLIGFRNSEKYISIITATKTVKTTIKTHELQKKIETIHSDKRNQVQSMMCIIWHLNRCYFILYIELKCHKIKPSSERAIVLLNNTSAMSKNWELKKEQKKGFWCEIGGFLTMFFRNYS